jgi:hypothetical protein
VAELVEVGAQTVLLFAADGAVFVAALGAATQHVGSLAVAHARYFRTTAPTSIAPRGCGRSPSWTRLAKVRANLARYCSTAIIT